MDANNCKMACSIISKYQPLLYLSTVDSMNKCHAPQFFDVRRSIHTHRFIFLFWSRHQTSPALKLSSSRLLVTRPCLVSGMTQLVRHRHTPQLCDHLCRLELVVLSPWLTAPRRWMQSWVTWAPLPQTPSDSNQFAIQVLTRCAKRSPLAEIANCIHFHSVSCTASAAGPVSLESRRGSKCHHMLGAGSVASVKQLS